MVKYQCKDKKLIIIMKVNHTKLINLLLQGPDNMLINFDFLSLAELDHFDTFPRGEAKLRLKTNSVQLKMKFGLSHISETSPTVLIHTWRCKLRQFACIWNRSWWIYANCSHVFIFSDMFTIRDIFLGKVMDEINWIIPIMPHCSDHTALPWRVFD